MTVLKQFGVPGMKWGIRKATTRGSTPPSKRKPKAEGSSVETEGGGGHKRVRDMTDAELQSKIRRIQLERQLDSLMQKPPPTKSKGRELVESILYDTGRDLGKKALTHIGTQALDRVIPGFAASQKKEKGKKNATVNDVRAIVEELKNASQNGSKQEKAKPKDEKKAAKEPEQNSADSPKKDEPSSPPPPQDTPKTGRPAPSGEGYPKGGSGESDSTRKRRFFGGRGRSAGRGARQTKPSGPVRVPDATVRSISREIVLRGSNY